MLASTLGPIACYLPLLAAVLLAGSIGGRWPLLILQFLGGLVVYLVVARPFSSPVSGTNLWSLLGFFASAMIAGSLLVRFRSKQLNRLSLEHLQLISQATHDFIWEWDLLTGYVWRGKPFSDLFGSPSQQQPTIEWWRARIDPLQELRVWDSIQEAITSSADYWSHEYRLRARDGTFKTVSDRARIFRNARGEAIRLIGGLADISAERDAQDKLHYQNSNDMLTDLPNRAAFLQRVEAESGANRAILYLDIDHLQLVNDGFGQPAGDQILVQLSRRLAQVAGSGDFVARFAGDEFTMLLEDAASPVRALQIAAEIAQLLNLPFRVEDNDLFVSASIGVAFTPGAQSADLLRQAGSAMKQAKRQGRGQIRLFDPSLADRTVYQKRLEQELRQSFTDGSLRLHYQPIVSIADGSLSSFEALLRWQHPKRGMILPLDILPVAESGNLSFQLSHWVLRETCSRLSQWQHVRTGKPLDLNVNLSGAEFVRPDLIGEVKQLLINSGISGESLIIELTETAIMESNIDAAQRLSQLRDLGIRLALDDFGKGHSSLGRLQDFPFSSLKIDASFVHQIHEGKRQILDAIIALAHELELEITAEGVETRQQLIYLKEKGAAKVQGLLFAPALTPEAATAILLHQPWNWSEYIHELPERSTGTAAS